MQEMVPIETNITVPVDMTFEARSAGDGLRVTATVAGFSGIRSEESLNWNDLSPTSLAYICGLAKFSVARTYCALAGLIKASPWEEERRKRDFANATFTSHFFDEPVAGSDKPTVLAAKDGAIVKCNVCWCSDADWKEWDKYRQARLDRGLHCRQLYCATCRPSPDEDVPPETAANQWHKLINMTMREFGRKNVSVETEPAKTEPEPSKKITWREWL